MEQNLVKEMNATDGMQLVCEMIKSLYIADVVEEIKGGNAKCHLVIISSGIAHTIRAGKPYYYTNEDVDTYQQVVKEIGMRLMRTEILSTPQDQTQYPLCYGDTFVEKFKVLRKIIVLPYLFEQIMGRTTRWQKMHLSDKKEKYYNSFTDAELEEINNAIRSIALRLCSVKLTYVQDKE